MNRAEQANLDLNQKRMSWTDLLNEAEEFATAYDQDLENESTSFEYSDGSVAVFCGQDQSIRTYGTKG